MSPRETADVQERARYHGLRGHGPHWAEHSADDGLHAARVYWSAYWRAYNQPRVVRIY